MSANLNLPAFPVTLDSDRVEELELAAKMACGLLRLIARSDPSARALLFDDDSPVMDLILDTETRLDLARQDARLGEIRGGKGRRAA